MILNVSRGSSIIFFVLFLMPLILASKSYFYGRGHYVFLNRSNIQALQGGSMILILIQCAIEQLSNADSILRAISGLGDIASAIFLFLTGYELVRLAMKNRQKIRGMMIQKMGALLLVLLGGNLLLGLVLIYLGEHIHLIEILTSTFKFQFVNGIEVSFIAVLFYFYLVILISYHLRFLWMASLLFSGLCYLQDWSLMMPFYVLGGAVLATYPRYAFLILKRHSLNLTLILGILMMVCFRLKVSYWMPWIGIVGSMIMLMKVQFKSTFFSLISRLAIPLYGVYLPVLYLVFYSSEPRSSFFVVLSLVISVVLVIGVKSRIGYFYNRWGL